MHDRRLDGTTLRFGNNGALFRNAMTWWDHQTNSVWSQPWGTALFGDLKARALTQIPAEVTPWGTWLAEHPDTLASRNNLANAYGDARRTDEAITLHKETLRLRESVLGAEHPDTLASRNNLAIAYRAVGRGADADRLMAGRDEDGNLS